MIRINGFKTPMLSQHLPLPTHVFYSSFAKNIWITENELVQFSLPTLGAAFILQGIHKSSPLRVGENGGLNNMQLRCEKKVWNLQSSHADRKMTQVLQKHPIQAEKTSGGGRMRKPWPCFQPPRGDNLQFHSICCRLLVLKHFYSPTLSGWETVFLPACCRVLSAVLHLLLIVLGDTKAVSR